MITPPNNSGIYTLILELKHDKNIKIGALGLITFTAGYYSYTGSARGSGGFARVKRHLRIAEAKSTTKRWHIDYLLPYTQPYNVVLTYTWDDLECYISNIIGLHTNTITGFGCSDCRCDGHLHFGPNIDQLIKVVTGAHNIKGTIQKVYSI
jgi:Uri superfamily endonuclease